MTAAPDRATSAPPSSHASIGLERILRPTCAFYRFLYDSVGRPWLWYERKLLADAEIERHLRDPRNELHLLLIGHEPAGFFQLHFAPPPAAELEFFGLRPEFIGVGLGRWFLDQAIARAWQRPIKRLKVNTCTLDHPGALSLYQSRGFAIVHAEDAVLQDPRLLWPELYR